MISLLEHIMEYSVSGKLEAHTSAHFTSKTKNITFGIGSKQNHLPNPAELLLGSFAACCLKNVDRFSSMLKFEYQNATIEVVGIRQEKPTKLIEIKYLIRIESKDSHLNPELLHRNLQKFGTIYNTLKDVLAISGEIILVD